MEIGDEVELARPMNFNDVLQTHRRMRKLQPLASLLAVIPGLHQPQHPVHTEAIILSMTLHERANPELIAESRIRRIARGSGTSPEQVNELVQRVLDHRRSP